MSSPSTASQEISAAIHTFAVKVEDIIVRSVRDKIGERLKVVLGHPLEILPSDRRGHNGHNGGALPVPSKKPHKAANRPRDEHGHFLANTKAKTSAKKTLRRPRARIGCYYPGCKNVAAPRFSMFCAKTHKDLPMAEKRKIIDARSEKKAAG